VPPGVWPVYIVANLPPGEGGIHLSDHNQPYANVEAGDGWTVAASHEVCELLVDPSGNRLQASTAIQITGTTVQDAPGNVEYLVEVCDPSETAEFGYIIDGVPVSDFYSARYFDPVSVPGTRYSFTGAITAPRQVLQGGYLSWWNPTLGRLQQLDFVQHNPPVI